MREIRIFSGNASHRHSVSELEDYHHQRARVSQASSDFAESKISLPQLVETQRSYKPHYAKAALEVAGVLQNEAMRRGISNLWNKIRFRPRS